MIKLKNLFTEIAFNKSFEEGDIISHDGDDWRILKYLSDKKVSISHLMTGAIFDVDIDSLSDAELVSEELLTKTSVNHMRLTEEIEVSENLRYHLSKKLSLIENMFRTYSDSYFELISEVRKLYFDNLIELCDIDADLVESDLGEKGIFEGREVYLDAPIEEEEDLVMEAKYKGKEVSLNKPFRTPSGPKKYAVYVKNKNGNVIKVTFGDPNLKGNWNDKAAQRSFVARHKCSQKNDKTKAGYWSCRIHKLLGNRGTGRYW